jgi:hypothetical protein
MESLLLLVGLYAFPLMATAAAPPAPQTVVIIGCRVDDLTGQPGRQDPTLAARGWRDLEWHFDEGLELQCKREVVPLEDAVAALDATVKPLASDFSDVAQCAHAGVMFSPSWEQANKGWAVMAIGCPVRIETDGILTGWKLPDCPSSVGGKIIRCRFDGSLI